MSENTALQAQTEGLPASLSNAIALWADARTSADSARRHDLLRDKTRAVTSFFEWTGKAPQLVTALDVKTWQLELEQSGLAPATVYALVSRVSSWYTWAMSDPALSETLSHNPVDLARPKAPKAYQNESVKALTDEQVGDLVRAVRGEATQTVVGKRDYALLLMFLATGKRRAELLRLTWRDVLVDGTVTIHTRKKGGVYEREEITDPRVRDALVAYLQASGRWDAMEPDSPLWAAHDRAGQYTGKALSSHGYAKRLKRYGSWVGLPDLHIHQLRHTAARLVAEDSGSITDTQDFLGHKNPATTRVYVATVATKKDRHSKGILDKVGA